MAGHDQSSIISGMAKFRNCPKIGIESRENPIDGSGKYKSEDKYPIRIATKYFEIIN